MTERMRLILAGVLPVAMLLMLPPILAQQAPETDSSQEGINVVIQFRIGAIEGKKRTVNKAYTLVVAAGSLGSELLAGQRVPFGSAKHIVWKGDRRLHTGSVTRQAIPALSLKWWRWPNARAQRPGASNTSRGPLERDVGRMSS